MIKYVKVVAGAGSGKTEVVKECYKKIVDINTAKGISMKDAMASIFMTTFTDAAAAEMKERIAGTYLSEGVTVNTDDMEIMTFDSFHYKNICNHFAEIGFTEPPRPIDEVRDKVIIADLITNPTIPGLNNKEFNMAGSGALSVAYKIFDLIASLDIPTCDVTSAESYDKITEACSESDNSYIKRIDACALSELCKIYADYQQLLIKNNLITFSNMAKYGLELLNAHPEILDETHYEYIVVDEFQDSDAKQLNTIKHLISTSYFKGIMVVGDDNQAIYGFRHTSPENMINFFDLIKAPEEETKTFFLMDNRRSTPEILDLADKFVALNVNKISKKSNPFREHGKKPFIRGFYNDEDEVSFIVDHLKEIHEDNPDDAWEDKAIIVRTGKEVLKFAAALSAAGIPWVSKSPMKLLENSRVLGAIALAKALEDPTNPHNYFEYCVAKYDGVIDGENADVFNEDIGLIKAQFNNLCFKDFDEQRRIFHQYLDVLKRPTDELYDYFLDCLYACEDLPSEVDYIHNILDFAPDFKKKMEANYAGVVLTTAHSSKGLEWPTVFVSLSEFDTKRLHRGHRSDDEIEEARRLIYVSMTRARDDLYVTGRYTAYGSKIDRTYNQFLKELYDITQMDFQPVDPMEAVREAERKAAYAARAKEKRYKKADDSIPFGFTQRMAYDPSKQHKGNKVPSSYHKTYMKASNPIKP